MRLKVRMPPSLVQLSRKMELKPPKSGDKG